METQIHTITFSEIFEVDDDLNWEQIADNLRCYDPQLQIKSVKK